MEPFDLAQDKLATVAKYLFLAGSIETPPTYKP
jgi:hypothetical protein